MKKLFVVTLLLFLTAGSAQANEIAFVSSAKAKVMAEPDFKAAVVAELQRADEVQVIKQQGAWLQVSYGGAESGWVSRLVVNSAPPLDRVSVLTGEEETSLRDVRRRTSAITTAAAARGLASSRQKDEKNSQHPSDYEALTYMESIQPTAAEIANFARPLQQGGTR